MSIEVMKQALEALETCTPEDTSTSHVIYAWHDEELVNKAIKALEEALAKQEQGEPVAWMRTSGTGSPVVTEELLIEMPEMRWNFQQPLYTHPQPKREWVGLTDEEVKKIAYNTAERKVAKDIEAKLKEKNDC